MKFDRIIETVLKYEGGYVNDKDDPGGETKFGISKRAYPEIDIKNLDEEDAIEIYRRDYWEKPRIAELPAGIAFSVFDMAVNAGSSRAIKILQKIVSAKADGVLGAKTLEAVNVFIEKNGTVEIIGCYTQKRNEYYRSLTKRNQVLSKFLHGWLHRARITEELSLENL